MPDYMNWLPDFRNLPLPKTEQEKKVEERKQKARLESGIVTANDKDKALIELNLKKAELAALYRREESAISMEGKPLVGNLSGLLSLATYSIPGLSTVMFADDASKDTRKMLSALRNKQFIPAFGLAIKVPADLTFGVTSLIPFTGSIIKEFLNIKNGLRSFLSNYLKGPVQTYGLVKYYGPTMGKTTASKSNPLLVDFDDVVRTDIQNLAKTKGVTPRELKIQSDPDYVKLLNDAVNRWSLNPSNEGKTLMISNKALSNPSKVQFSYDNIPSIPSLEVFVRRNVSRGGTPLSSLEWYEALLKENPNLKLDNRYVSTIENGSVQPTTSKLKETGEIAATPKLGNAALSELGDALNLSMFVLPGSKQVKEIITAAKNIPNVLMKIKRIVPYSIGVPHNEKNAYRILHQIEAEDILNGSPLRLGKTNPAKIAFDADKMLHAKSNKGIILIFKSGAEHGGRKLFSKGTPWEGTTVTNGTPWYLEMPGNNLPWVKGRHYRNSQGIRESGSVVFEEAPIGSHIDLLADVETGLTNIFPSLIPGSTIYKPTYIKYIYKKIPVRPYQKKSGGKLNYLNFFK